MARQMLDGSARRRYLGSGISSGCPHEYVPVVSGPDRCKQVQHGHSLKLVINGSLFGFRRQRAPVVIPQTREPSRSTKITTRSAPLNLSVPKLCLLLFSHGNSGCPVRRGHYGDKDHQKHNAQGNSEPDEWNLRHFRPFFSAALVSLSIVMMRFARLRFCSAAFASSHSFKSSGRRMLVTGVLAMLP